MDMNGHASLFTQMQAMQQFEQFVQGAMQQALGMLAPGYKPTVIFSFKGRPDRDIIITAAGLDDVFKALASKMQANGLALPQQAVTAPAANDQQSPDLHLAVINVVSAIRRSMPFITGPGADTAKRMLLDAISAEKASETARQVVAGYMEDAVDAEAFDAKIDTAATLLASLPGVSPLPVEHVRRMIEAALRGQGKLLIQFVAGK